VSLQDIASGGVVDLPAQPIAEDSAVHFHAFPFSESEEFNRFDLGAGYGS
jgi:hypothetical protein